MKVNYVGKSRLTDNESRLYNDILTLLQYTDPELEVKLYSEPDKLITHIIPSSPEIRQELINNLLWINKYLGVKVIFSKSLKISNVISFQISLSNS